MKPKTKRKVNGAISIFMTIVTLSSFLLGGVFIDATRILAAQNKVKVAMNSAARSAMSNYNSDLISEYGLYGIDNETLNKNFKKYFKLNMEKSEYDGVKLFKYTIDDNKLKMNGKTRLSKDLKEQVLKYEKYRAPAVTTYAVIERVKKELKNMFGAKRDKADKAKSKAEDVKKQFNTSSANLQNIGKTMAKNIGRSLVNSIGECLENFLEKGIGQLERQIDQNAEEAFSNLEAELAKMEAELNKLNEKKAEYEAAKNDANNVNQENADDGNDESLSSEESAELDEQIAEASKFDDSMNNAITKLDEEIKELRTKILDVKSRFYIKKTEVLNAVRYYQQMEGELETAEQKLTNANDSLETAKKNMGYAKIVSAAANASSEENKQNRNINSLLSKMFGGMSDEEKKDYEDYKLALDKSKYDWNAKNDVENIEKKYTPIDENGQPKEMKEPFKSYRKWFESRELAQTAQANLNTANSNLTWANQAVKNAENEVDRCETNVADAKANAEQKKKELEDITREIVDMNVPKIAELTEGVLKKNIKKAKDENTIISGVVHLAEGLTAIMPEIEVSQDEMDAEKLSDGYNSVTSGMDKYAAILNGDLTPIRDKIYLVDYIMNKCTYVNAQGEKSHYFDYGEVEYILYGQKSQAANIGISLGVCFGFRFIVDSTYYIFFDKSAMAWLWPRIGYGLFKGLIQAAKDLKDMLIADDSGEAPGCVIWPSASNTAEEKKGKRGIRMYYSDFLRIQLLLIMSEDKGLEKLERTMNATLKADNTSAKGTGELYSDAEASVEVEVNLLMIPMFVGMLPGADKFRDGKYVIKYSEVFEY